MSLRTKLLLSLTVLALIPLFLFGLAANAAATSSLINVERDNLQEASASVKGGLDYIESKLVDTLSDNANWDDMHKAVSADPADQDFFTTNYDPTNSGSTTSIFGLDLIGIWNGQNKLVYSIGPVEEFTKQTGATVKTVLDNNETPPGLLAVGPDIYMVAYRPIQTTEGKDPNGMLAFGRKLGSGDFFFFQQKTAYDIALYKGQ